MKRLIMILSLLGAGAAAPGGAGEPVAAQPEPKLQVRVLLPPTGNPIHEDDVIDVFVGSVREAFRRQGYEGRLEDLRFRDEPVPELPLLTMRVVQWKRNRTGGIDCTFSAAVRPGGGEERSLGMFHALEMSMNVTTRWQLGEAFRDAAEQAATDLWRRLAGLNVVPGITSAGS